MRVLVTGAGGYLGRAVVSELAAAGHEPVAMTHTPGREVHGATETRVAELTDADAVRQAVTGADTVIHLAGLTRVRESLTDPMRFFHVNTGGTITLLDAMAAAGVPRMVFSSTCSVYGSPERQPMTEDLPDAPPHPYASSKLAAELAVAAQAQSGTLGAIVLRLPNLAGGDDRDPTRLIPRALDAAVHQTDLGIHGDGTAVRDYLHLRDAATAFVACVDYEPAVGTCTRYNVGSGRGTSVLDVVAAVERVTGLRVSVEHKPAVTESPSLINDSTRFRTELGWIPRRSDIATIIRDTWAAAAAKHRRQL